MFKFIGITSDVNPNNSCFICNNSKEFSTLKKFGTKQSIEIIDVDALYTDVTIELEKTLLICWYYINMLEHNLINNKVFLEKLLGQKFNKYEQDAYRQIRKYYSILKNELWLIKNPYDKISKLEKEIFEERRDFIRSIARSLEIAEGSKRGQDYLYDDILCNGAANVKFLSKIEYFFAVIECALLNDSSDKMKEFETIAKKLSPSINVIRAHCDNLNILLQFLQFWIYILGGIIDPSNDGPLLKKYLKLDDQRVIELIELLRDLFSVKVNGYVLDWGIIEDLDQYIIVDIPLQYRGFGIYFRKLNKIQVEEFIYAHQWEKRFNELLKYL